jgi:hypothetical protein
MCYFTNTHKINSKDYTNCNNVIIIYIGNSNENIKFKILYINIIQHLIDARSYYF